MSAEIIRHQADQEYWFHEGCHILELANSSKDPDMSIARARVEPGMRTQWHHLNNICERYLIIQGKGMVEIGDLAPTLVTAGDMVRIPAGERQRIYNTGSEDLIFYAICTPRFEPECYVALENSSDSDDN